MARLRLFGLLALLVPIFAGLQYIVREGVPRVEVRLVMQDVQTTVPVEVPVERVVERVVYVAVGGQTTVPPSAEIAPARAIVPSAPEGAGLPDVQIGGIPPAGDASPAPEPPGLLVDAEPVTETAPLTGTVALAPPPAPVAAAPRVVARAAPVAAQPAEEPVAGEAEAEEVVAEAEAPDEVTDEVEEVAEAEPEARPVTLVAHFVGNQPVTPEEQRASAELLRRAIAAREPRPRPVAEEPVGEAVDEPAPTDEPVADEPAPTDEAGHEDVADEPGPASDAVADEPAPAEPVADGDESVGEAEPVESDGGASQPEAATSGAVSLVADPVQNSGELASRLIPDWPVAPAPNAEHGEGESGPVAEDGEPGPVPEDEPTVATSDAEEPAESVASEAGDGPDEAPVAGADVSHQEVARTEESAPVEGEPEQ